MAGQETLQLRTEAQKSAVADEVSALTAMVRPILEATLYALSQELVAEVGGHSKVSLKVLSRLYKPGDGDCGICFEWAVHDALNRREPSVLERLTDAMRKHCKVPGSDPASILFGAEKTGALKLIDTAERILTDDSRLLTGTQTQPPKLKRYLRLLAAALRRPEVRTGLPHSISGLWKADLFLGNKDSDRWIGTSVKINRAHLEGARGLRVGIVPATEGKSDKTYFDSQKNLVVCPLPYDGSFMQTFYEAWQIVQQFIDATARVPGEAALPRPPHRQVARFLAERRDFTVVDVVDALRPLSQPGLLTPVTSAVDVVSIDTATRRVGTVVAPLALLDGVPYEAPPPTAVERLRVGDKIRSMQHSDWLTLAPYNSSPPIRIGPVESAGRVVVESSDGDLTNLFVLSCMFGNVDKMVGGVLDAGMMANDAFGDVFFAEAGRIVTVRVENKGASEKRVRIAQGL